jgi:ferritin-like metal-binding protein YciE
MAKRGTGGPKSRSNGKAGGSIVEAAAEAVGRTAGRVIGAVQGVTELVGGRSRTLHEAFVDELRDAYDAEAQLVKALPKLATAAASPKLRSAFEAHLEQTRTHVERLQQVFASIEEKARGKHCRGIAGIIDEGNAVMRENFDESTLDACLIAAGQRAEHYEMAAYGTLVAWARAMGHGEAVELLEGILDEEKAADAKLSALAEGGINQQASPPGMRGNGGEHRQGRRSPQRGAPAPARAQKRRARASR